MPTDENLIIPKLKDIIKIPFNGFNVVSTFSGAGGSSLGYRMAGFRVIWVNEFMEKARESYKLNASSSTILNGKDIRQLKASDILNEINLDIGEIDILDGSPPCASFSTQGKRDKDWGKVKSYSKTQQRTDDLFFEYIRLVRLLKPKIFVAENVSGLIKGRAKGYFLEILKEFKESGYNVKVKLLKAHWLHVPQMRERLFFIGIRNDLNKEPEFPVPKSTMTRIRDVLPYLNNKNLTDTDVIWIKENTRMKKLWQYTKAVTNFQRAGFELFGKKGSYFGQVKASPDKPCNTILTTAMYHWNECRFLTIPEIKLFSTFPEDFKLTGSFMDKWERVGRAVPPFMAKEIAIVLRDKILNKC